MTKTKKKAGPSRRKYPDVRVRINVACQSDRDSGATIRLITVHDTEGANIPDSIRDLQGLGSFFDRTATQASSHVATDSDGYSARFVPDTRKAWHCAAYNSASLGIEQVGFATETEWPEAQLKETARWIAYWSRKHGIPIQKGAVANGSVTRSGVVRHSDLGTLGGGHHDPGPHYPLAHVLDLAREFRDRQNRKGA